MQSIRHLIVDLNSFKYISVIHNACYVKRRKSGVFHALFLSCRIIKHAEAKQKSRLLKCENVISTNGNKTNFSLIQAIEALHCYKMVEGSDDEIEYDGPNIRFVAECLFRSMIFERPDYILIRPPQPGRKVVSSSRRDAGHSRGAAAASSSKQGSSSRHGGGAGHSRGGSDHHRREHRGGDARRDRGGGGVDRRDRDRGRRGGGDQRGSGSGGGQRSRHVPVEAPQSGDLRERLGSRSKQQSRGMPGEGIE